MTSRAVLPIFAFIAFLASSTSSADEPAISMVRLSDEGSLVVSIVRAERGQSAEATVVVVLQGPRGNSLLLRRTRPEPGVTLHEAGLGRNAAVSFTRRGGDPVVFEAGGRTLRFYEADLGRATVRCWLAALVSRVDPKILEAAAGIRLLKEWTGASEPGDAFYPARVLADVAEPLDIQPRGAVRVERGPFTGEPWDQLSKRAVGELGRP